jgi:hypothetical protein
VGNPLTLVVPVLEWVGAIGGAIMTANQIDNALGSPVKEAVGLDYDDEPDYDVVVRQQQERENARQRVEGLSNYIDALESVAPGYVHRNRNRLIKDYGRAIDRREQKVEGLEIDLAASKTPFVKVGDQMKTIVAEVRK